MQSEMQRGAEQRYLLVALPDRGAQRSRKARGRLRIFRRALVGALAIIFIFFGGGIAASPQQAGNVNASLIDTDALCGYTPVFSGPLPTAWPGVSGLIADLSTPFAAVIDGGQRFDRYTQPYDKRPVTAEEWYGSAGFAWTTSNYKAIDGLCFGGLLRTPAGWFSSLIWGVVVLIGSLGLNLYDVATSVNVFDGFLDTVDVVIRALASTLFLPFLMPIVMIGALWMGWQGLVKRRSSEAVQGAVWMVAATCAGFIFLGQPKFIATAINDVVTTVSTTIISTVASPGTQATNNQQGRPCSLPGDPVRVSTRVTKCALWYTFLFTPWAEGQFGEANGTITVEGFYNRADGTLFTEFTSENMPSIGKGANAKPLSGFAEKGQSGIPIAWLQMAATTFNHDEVICAVRQLPCQVSREDMLTAKTDLWWGITQRLAQSEDGFSGAQANLLDWEGQIPDDGSWSPPPGAWEWSGFRTEHRFLIALLAFVAMIAGAAPVMFISFILVIQQIGFIFLLLFAPVFLLLGVHPGFGRRIAMNWIEQILSLSLKRIGNSLVLGVLLAMVAAVLSSGGSWFAQVILTVAVSATAIIFRKRIVDGISQVNLGGSGGDFGQQASSSMRRATSSTVNSAANTATQLAGGGGSGGLMGSLVGGAVAGAGGAALLGGARGGKNSRRIKKEEKEQTAYEKWYESTPVGQFEMEEYRKMDSERIWQRERLAMDRFTGSPEEVEKWKEWANKYGEFDEFGRFIERPLPRPDNEKLAQILRDAGITLQEDLGEQFALIMEAAEDYAETNSEGVRFKAPVERPQHPALENWLRKEGISFTDDFQRNAIEVKAWSEQYGTVGANGEVVPRAVPLPENPHLERVYFEAGITKFEDKDGNTIILGAGGQQEIIYPDEEIPIGADPTPEPTPQKGPKRPPPWGQGDGETLF